MADLEGHRFQPISLVNYPSSVISTPVNLPSCSGNAYHSDRYFGKAYTTTGGVSSVNWIRRVDFLEATHNHHQSLYFKMETDDKTNNSDSLNNDDFVPEAQSRSSSPSEEYDSQGKKGDASKVCGVCGDKALGNNFNAITCESCKAFFRRNALKTKDFVCPFNDSCKVDAVTRRFCQKCRLKKCFEIGMKKEWIMTDEEKKMKKQKIEQNRMKRQSSDVPLPCDAPASKSICISDQYSPKSSGSETHMGNKIHIMDEADFEGIHQIPSITNLHSKEEFPHSPHSPPASLSAISPSDPQLTSKLRDLPNCTLSHLRPSEHLKSEKQLSEAQLGNNVILGGFWEEENLDHSKYFLRAHGPNKQIYYSIPSTQEGDQIIYRNDIGTGGPVTMRSIGNQTCNSSQMPLLSSLIRPGLAESPPDAILLDCSNSSLNHSHSVGDLGEPSLLNGSSHNCNGDRYDAESKYCLRDHECPDLGPPLPINTMDSILSVAITAEFNAFGVLGKSNGSGSRTLNKAETAKLNELRLASQALYAPVDAEGPINVSETSDPSLINVINLTDIAIRRLIKMSKKISGFKNMCQDDQIALLKGSCTEMMILRSVVSYDPDRDSWNIPHSNLGYNIKMGVLKEARGNLYEEHQRFVKSFKAEWRNDENIMIILCAITLFTAERPNVIHKDVIKLEQDSYYYLLKRYLESILNGCEARSTYLQLIKKIAELHILNSNTIRVFLEVNPREVEPLLIEIFDLKQ